MKRILVLYSREWLHPRPDATAGYIYQVFSRIAAQGYEVTWLAHHYGAWRRSAPPRIETVDGIRIARLGLRCFYPTTVGMFFDRWERKSGTRVQFDLIVDCITRRPVVPHGTDGARILPMVFGGRLAAHYIREHHGPFLAVGERAAESLRAASVPENLIIRAPGVVPGAAGPEPETWESTAGLILAVVEIVLAPLSTVPQQSCPVSAIPLAR